MSKKILFAVLNWGLGHASRSASIIQTLIDQNHEVIFCSDGIALTYLIDQFPTLKYYSLPQLDIKYPTSSISLNMSYQWPKLLLSIHQEHKEINRIAKIENPYLIISDNRYGCFSKDIRSIFITHQLNLPISNIVLRKIANRYIKHLVQRFDECWIPDYPTKALSGNLSLQEIGIPMVYIGPISHFTRQEKIASSFKHDLIVILSGPEPQRTKLEELLIQQLNKLDLSVLIVQGNPNIDQPINITNEKIKWVTYLGAKELYREIANSTKIICRSGYSSIMDLDQIKRTALLIPTPGQTEQEYLAQKAQHSGNHRCVTQSKVNLEKDLGLVPSIYQIRSAQDAISFIIKNKI